VKGGPEPPSPALESVVAAVADGNAERFLVCTQDDKLRKMLLKESPMTPVIFCHTSGLQMEPPAEAIGSGVATRRETGEGLSERERRTLQQEESAADVARVRTNVRYAKPKARGPNPLACKKKKVKEPKSASGAEQNNKQEGAEKKKRKRR
jgi:U3 small nucleolar RNA-associated protein 23